MGNLMKIFFTVFGILFAASAQAATVTWTLSDVTFSGGGTASGSFNYDADTNLYSNFSVSTTATPLNPGDGEPKLTWGTATSCASYFSASSASELQCQNDSTEFSLTLAFASDLTNAGGSILLQPASGRFGSKERRGLPTQNEVDSRSILTGSVMASAVVPVPAAVWLFGSGLGLLGFVSRKKRTVI